MRKSVVMIIVVLFVAIMVPARIAAREIVILPEATGTVSFSPELGHFGMPVGNSIQSRYNRTTLENRGFRRGFLEFSIPDLGPNVVQATLLLEDQSGTSDTPMEAVLHEIGSYEADLAITTNDYAIPTQPVGRIETDHNLPAERTIPIDITTLFQEFRGRNLGFRIKLVVDPEYSAMGVQLLGAFAGNYHYQPSRIAVLISNPPPVIALRTVKHIAFEPYWRVQRQDGRFVITRSGNTNESVQVVCEVGGTAQNGVDYATIPSAIEIPAGVTSVAVPVRPFADLLRERPETVRLQLLPSPEGAYKLGERVTGRVLIIDNPQPLFFLGRGR